MGVQNVVLRNYHNYSVLQSAIGLMKLKIESHISGAGDHDIFICGIEDWETAASATDLLALYTGTLRDQGLL